MLDNFLIFPAVLVGHYQSEIFGVLLVIAEFLLSLPLLEVAFYDFEALRFFEVDADRYLFVAYRQFHRLAFACLLFLLGAKLDVVDLFHVLQLLLNLHLGYAAVDD